MQPDYSLLIGKIVGVHGLKGTLKLLSYAESPDFFQPGDSVFFRDGRGAFVPYTIAWAKPHHRTVLISLETVEDRNRAETFVGKNVFIDKRSLPDLEDDTYYWFELIGLRVITIDGEVLGRIDSIIPTGSNDVYVVKGKGTGGREEEHLVPALASVVIKVDLTAGEMVVDLPEEMPS